MSAMKNSVAEIWVGGHKQFGADHVSSWPLI
jgi:hypothetical protein